MSLPYFVPGIPDGESLPDLAALEALVADLRAYAEGRVPTEAELATAPLLSHWFPMPDTWSTRLAGRVVGHPRVRPGDGVTSRVYAVDRSYRWMRSYSRLWRLGPQMGADDNVRSH